MDNGVGFGSMAPSMVSSTAGCPVFCWAAKGSVVSLGDVVSWLSELRVSVVDQGLKGEGGGYQYWVQSFWIRSAVGSCL
jgi:hypothetical protein